MYKTAARSALTSPPPASRIHRIPDGEIAFNA